MYILISVYCLLIRSLDGPCFVGNRILFVYAHGRPVWHINRAHEQPLGSSTFTEKWAGHSKSTVGKNRGTYTRFETYSHKKNMQLNTYY